MCGRTELLARGCSSADGAQCPAQLFCSSVGERFLDILMRALPDRNRAKKDRVPLGRETKNTTASICRIGRNPDESLALQRFQCGGESGPIHREKGSDGSHGRRFRTIQGHQKGELSIGQPERSQYVVEAPRQRTCSALHVETETAIPHEKRSLVRYFFCS